MGGENNDSEQYRQVPICLGSNHRLCGQKGTREIRCPPAQDCNGLPQGSLPTYRIDAGAAAGVEHAATFVITANGQGDWYLGWLGDHSGRTMSGTVAAPLGLSFTDVHYLDTTLGGNVTTHGVGSVEFFALVNHEQQQILSLSLDPGSAPDAPLIFSLQLDGQNAFAPLTLWPYQGNLDGPTAMPFLLATEAAAGFAGHISVTIPGTTQGRRPAVATQPSPSPRPGPRS